MSDKITNLFSLSGKVALVTGAARGNGRAIAKGFLDAGATVYFLDILEDQLIKTVRLLNNERARALTADISQKKDLEKAVKQIISQAGKIDILVNNAGISISEPSESYSEESWEKTYNVNLKSAFSLCQMTSKTMIKQKSGSIINITSLGAEFGLPDNPAYVAFKGGLKQLTKALANDWGKYNIRVNNLGPGYIKTEMTKKSWSDHEKEKQRSQKTMLGRWGEPEDLAGPAIFLASDASSYVTGQDLFVDGGWRAKGL